MVTMFIFPIVVKLALLALILTFLFLMLLAIPLGLEVFFFERISQFYTFESIYSIKLLDLHIETNVGLVFAFFSAIYLSCFFASIKKGVALHKSEEGDAIRLIRNPLFALPLLSSLSYVISKIILLIQESYNIPLGEAPISADPLLAFLNLSISPFIEELIFRITPVGTFLATYLFSSTKLSEIRASWRKTLKFLLLVFRSPDEGKKVAGLKTVKDYGFFSSINLREWFMIILTSAIFGFSHIIPPTTWKIGKFSLTFIQGLIMGLSYVAYGFQAPIIIHWFFNYHQYVYGLVRIVHPNIAFLAELNNYLVVILGVLSLTLTFFSIIKILRETGPIIFHISKKLKSNLEIKCKNIFRKVRDVKFKSLRSLNFALLILVLAFLVIRLLIINFPSPESGEKYSETGFVFDEVYYVKAARSLIRGEPANNEHPPLVKFFIMAGILFFGDNPIGWRLFSILSSSISIILLYLLTLNLTKSKITSLLAAILFAFDIMAFNIGQIAMLDASSLMFVLIGSIFLIRDKYDLGGVFFGLALLCKVSSLFSLGVLLFLLLKMISKRGSSKIEMERLVVRWILLSARILLFSFIMFLSGLWIYDVAYNAFNGNPLSHIAYILNYHSILKYQDVEEVILPLRWINPLNPFPPIPYHVVAVREFLNGTLHEFHPIAYYGIYSPLWWSIWIVTPLSLKETIKNRRIQDLFILIWIMTNFLPYVVFAYLLQRWVYPFYFYASLPGLYMGLSYYLTAPKRRRLRIFAILLILLQVVWFIIWFPVKPKQLIDILSSLGLPA